jgi:predicted nucleic acid-binding protein
MLEWRRRLSKEESDRGLAALAKFGITILPPPSSTEYDQVFDLGRKESLTVYDATYLWDAMHGGFTLASRDADLLAAASRHNVPIEDLRG